MNFVFYTHAASGRALQNPININDHCPAASLAAAHCSQIQNCIDSCLTRPSETKQKQ